MNDFSTCAQFFDISNTETDAVLEQDLEKHIASVVDDVSNAYQNGYAAMNSIPPVDASNFLLGYERDIDDVFDRTFVLHMLAIIYNNPDGDNAYPFLSDVENYKRRIGVIRATFISELCDFLQDEITQFQALYEALMYCWTYEQDDPDGIRLLTNDDDEISQD